MKRFSNFITAFIAFFCIPVVHGQDIFSGYEHLFTSPRQYIACQTTGPILIDGKLTEPSWQQAPWSDYFKDIEGDLKPAPALKTRFKLLWDQQNIYIIAEMEEPHIWATLKKHDEVIFYDNDFEVFIDPDGDTHNYFELEVNAFNTIFDLFLPKPYRNGGPALLNWNMANLKTATSVQGTINQPKDKDKKWLVEMAIPFRSISLGDRVQVPRDKSTWRINFSRIEWDVTVKEGKYVKQIDSLTHRPKAEHNWVWSPQGVVNMHFPERWGYLHFSTQKAGAPLNELPLPAAEEYKKYLWLLYYKQGEYRQRNKTYAATLSQLNFPALINLSGINCSMSLEAGSSQFKAIIKAMPNGESWQINQEGKINKVRLWSTKDNF